MVDHWSVAQPTEDQPPLPDTAGALAHREAVLDALLAAHDDAIVAALTDSGFRIPLPGSFPLGGRRALEVPPERASMLDVVVAADRIAVVTGWERARKHGVGVVAVHPMSAPQTCLTLSMIDARARYGAWVAVLTRGVGEPNSDSALLAARLVVPQRPRQATMHKNMTAVITGLDANVTRMFGWTAQQMLGSRSTDFIHPEDHEGAVAAWMQLLSSMASQRVRLRHRCADGNWLWVEVEHVHNGAEDPDEVDVVAYISDITDEMAAHEALRRREQLFSRLAEALPTGVQQLRHDGSTVYANVRLAELLWNQTPRTASDLLTVVAPGDRPAVQAAIQGALRRGLDHKLEVEVCPRGTPAARRYALTVVAVDDQDGQPGALICIDDVTESAKLRDALKLQATHDALTGCLNRSAAHEAVEQLLSRPDAHRTAVIFVDVDNFKAVNDQFGHATGDKLLTHLARRLRRLARGHDLVARFGGDEFLLVCCDVELPAQAAVIADRVRAALGDPITLATRRVNVQASIGVAVAEPGTTAETLIARADAAMYQSKRQGRGQPVVYVTAAKDCGSACTERWHETQARGVA